MGVRPQPLLALLAAGVLATACSMHSPSAGPPVASPGDGAKSASGSSALDVSEAAREAASEAAIQSLVDAKLRSGWIYQVRGTAHGVDVAPGKQPRFTFGPGDSVDVVLVPNGQPRYRISGTRSRARTTRELPVSCDGCDDGGGANPTPEPQPTPPPNYGPCASSGGATWFNSATGDGGCVPRGGSKSLSCGAWSWSSRGKGTLTPPNNGIPLTDFDWITVNDDGSCHLGYFPS
jgi:hypothetical protein